MIRLRISQRNAFDHVMFSAQVDTDSVEKRIDVKDYPLNEWCVIELDQLAVGHFSTVSMKLENIDSSTFKWGLEIDFIALLPLDDSLERLLPRPPSLVQRLVETTEKVMGFFQS